MCCYAICLLSLSRASFLYHQILFHTSLDILLYGHTILTPLGSMILENDEYLDFFIYIHGNRRNVLETEFLSEKVCPRFRF